MVKTILKILFSSILFLLTSQPVFAATTVSIISAPSSTAMDTPFGMQVNIQGDPNTSYNLKARIGINTSSLTKGLTNNSQNTAPDDWLSDTDSWSKFPSATTDSSGYWQGSLTAKTSTTSTIGDNLLIFRVRKVSGSTTTYDSTPSKTITLSSPTPTPSPSPSTTSTFTISNVPSSIDSTQTFTTSINLELSSYPNTKFYLKGAFAKSGSTNYFGFTKVSDSWVKNGNTYSDQYSITTDSSGKWSGSLEIQPDVFDSGYEGTNDYIFKIGRYTGSGNGPTWSNEVNIKINAKAVEMAEESINLTGLSAPKPSAVLGESKEEKNLQEVVYSLENYKKSSTRSAKQASPSSKIKVASKKIPVLLYIAGGILLFASGGLAVYLFLKNRLKSLS